MHAKQTRNRHSPFFLISLIVIMVLLSGLMLASVQAQDGRVNPVEHVGGAAVYCVDETFTPAANWSNGGIRVLNANGQELLFAPAADILAEGDPPDETLQVGSGANAYGPLTLYYRPDSKFQLMGTDEHGKDFEFVWGGCGYEIPAEVPEVTLEPTQCVLPSGAVEAQAIRIDPCNQID